MSKQKNTRTRYNVVSKVAEFLSLTLARLILSHAVTVLHENLHTLYFGYKSICWDIYIWRTRFEHVIRIWN